MMIEKSFPRGGTIRKPAPDPLENEVFGVVQKKPRKSKPKNVLEELLEDENKDNIESKSADLLNYNTVQDGMNIMGMIKHVSQLYLTISLPGRMQARVNALNISDSYTKATKEFLANTDSEQEFKSLTELFEVGQIVYGRVQEVKKYQSGRVHLDMSLKPIDTHADLVRGNVKKGFIFCGAIEEIQEHGLIIESGIKGLRTFVPLDQKLPNPHAVGQLIHLKVEKITQDPAARTCFCKELKWDQLKIKNQTLPNIDYILPGTIVDFSVNKILKNGLQGTIMNEAFTAYANEHQLAEPLALPEDYEVKAVVKARILYVMPLTKLVYLTLNLRNSEEDSSLEPAYKRGDTIENATVHHMGTGGVVIVLDKSYKGVLPYRSIKANYKGNYDKDELLTKYAKKTKHKVRVLDFNLMDSLYVCTDDTKVVEEKIFSFDDVKAGDFLTAEVKTRNKKVNGYTLKLGNITGIIENIFLSPANKILVVKSRVRCRVIAVDRERKVVYLTNRPEYLQNDRKILTSLEEAKENSLFTGTIVKCEEKFVVVRFFNDLKGILHRQLESKDRKLEQFYVGQTIPFRIFKRKGDQIELSLPDDSFQMGDVLPVNIVNLLDSGLEIDVKLKSELEDENQDQSTVKAVIPLRLISDYVDLLYAKQRMFPANSETKAVYLFKNTFSLRDVEYFQKNPIKYFSQVEVGDVLRAYIKNVKDDVVELMLPIVKYNKLVKVHQKMLIMNNNSNITLTPEQVIYVRILSKEPITKTLAVSAKLTDVWESDLNTTSKITESYLKEVAEIKKYYKEQSKPIADFTIGEKMSAKFVGVNPESNDWLYQLTESKITVIAKSSSIKPYAVVPDVGTDCQLIILWIDYSNEIVFVSNKESDMEHIESASQPVSSNYIGKIGINAKVLLQLDNIFICSLKKPGHPLIYCPNRLHFNDFENSNSITVKEGQYCKLAFIHRSQPIAVLEGTWKLCKSIKRKRKEREELNELLKKKAKLSKETSEVPLKVKPTKRPSEQENEKQKESLEKKIKIKSPKEQTVKSNKKANKLVNETIPSSEAIFFEDKTRDNSTKTAELVNTIQLKKKALEHKALPGITDYWNTDLTQLLNNGNGDSSSEEDDEEEHEDANKKKKRLTAANKFKQQRDEEARLRAIEEKYADPNQMPESVDQFDRLVLSDPNSSKNWINYMVFHLQAAEIDKARAVAQRALKSISFRNSNEQLNIWVALLNLELRYGTKETFDTTLKDAVVQNEPIRVYQRTLDILSEAKKTQELTDMVATVTKKFKSEPDAWKSAANALFSVQLTENAQKLLQKALVCLPERDHINMIVTFANLNHKHGQNEMAQTLMDQIVTSYPKRVDVWAQYVDLLVKENLIDSARLVFERAVLQKIPFKKMRTIFKKYLDFEERFGTEAKVQGVKELATEYVKNHSNL